MKGKISVIVPCYNVEKYLGACLESLVGQTIGTDAMEIILVNDGSEDSTLSIMMEWEQKHSEMVLLINCEQNMGMSAARNLAMTYASGEYIAFVDSDDCVAPYYLERLREIANSEQSDIVLCKHTSNREDISEEKNGMEDIITYACSDVSVRKEFLVSHIGSTAVWAKLFRRSFLEQANLHFPEGVCYEDTLFTYSAYMQANRVSKCTDVLYYYLRHMESITLSGNEQRERNRLVTLRLFYGECIRHGWLDVYYEELAALFVCKYYGEMIEVMFRKFETVDYALFCAMRDWLAVNFPDIRNNPYLAEHEIEQVYLKFIYSDFDSRQLQEIRSVFLQSLYQTSYPQTICSVAYRISTYPVKEEMCQILNLATDAGKQEHFGKMLYEALTCVPISTKESEIAAFCQDYSIPEKVKYYQYITDRESVLAIMQDEIRRAKPENDRTNFFRELLQKVNAANIEEISSGNVAIP